MRRIVMGALMAGLATVGAASAQPGAGMPRALDLDGDGMIQRSEVSAANDARFRRLDTNGDGMVSKDEFDAAIGQVFSAMDTNGDGALSRVEIRGRAEQMRRLMGPGRPMGPLPGQP